MIIDTHVHIGGKPFSNDGGIPEMSEEMTWTALTRYNIDMALVSNCDSSEVDHSQVLFPPERQISQIDSLNRMLKFARLSHRAFRNLAAGAPSRALWSNVSDRPIAGYALPSAFTR